MYILKATGYIIEPVFTFAAFIIFAGYCYGAELGWQQVFCIIKSKANLSNTTGTAGFASIKNKAFEVFTTQVADLMLPYHPTDTIYNITFSATIGAYNSGDAFIKIKYSLISKTFKSFYF